MTNPDNIVRVRARNGGRASVYEANAWCQMLNAGLLEGNGVLQNTSADMNVLVGGSASKPDVVIATAPSGYHVALDIVGQQAVAITAPATNSRISAVVAYTDDLSLSTTEDTVTGSPASCGLIVVNGTTSANPTNPTEATIRSAITADGATGSQAAYVVIAYITVSSATTAITNTLISIQQSGIQAQNIQPASIDSSKLAANAVDTSNIANSAVTASKIDFTTLVVTDLYTTTRSLNSDGDIGSFTVPKTGSYYVAWLGRVVVPNSLTFGNLFSIAENDTEIYSLGPVGFYPTSNTNRIGAPSGTIVSLTAGTTVKVRCPVGASAEVYGSVNGVLALFLG